MWIQLRSDDDCAPVCLALVRFLVRVSFSMLVVVFVAGMRDLIISFQFTLALN